MAISKQKKIQNYTIIGLLGKGGMSEVYLAKHPTLKREVVLKKLKIKDREFRERFLREAKVMFNFHHDNIVQVYDYFKEGSAAYIAMEYVKGKTLNQVIKDNKKIPVPLALFILYQVALGLHHAHQKKVVHRDIKPHNILISLNGVVKIADFGIAFNKSGDSKDITETGTVIGTPAYMSPEQFSSSKDISYQSDIYSLGVVFYEMITGVRPFKNEYSSDVIEAIANGKFNSPAKYIDKYPFIARRILSKTFTPNVSRRYKSLLPLIKLLKNYFSHLNTYEIRATMQRLVRADKNINNSSIIQKIEKIKLRKIKIFLITSAIIIVSLLSMAFIKSKKYYDWFAAGFYGKVKLAFNPGVIDESRIIYGVDGKFHTIKIDKKIPTVLSIKKFWGMVGLIKNKKEIRFIKRFYKFKKEKNKKYYKLIAKINKKDKQDIMGILTKWNYFEFNKILYLKKGNHKFVIISGSYKNTREALIESMHSLKLQNKKDLQRVFIPISFWNQEVILYMRFWDSLTHKLLFRYDPKKADRLPDTLYIYYKKRYILLKDYIKHKKDNNLKPFYSSRSYYFLVKGFSVENGKDKKIEYKTRKFKIKFSIDDRSVVSHFRLVRGPASLTIVSNTKNLPIIIDGKEYGNIFISKNKEYSFVKYKDIKSKGNKKRYTKVLQIPPGKHTFQISRTGKKIYLDLNSTDTQTITIKKDKKTGYEY